MRLPLMSEEESTVTLIHPAPGATAKSRLKGEAKEGTAGSCLPGAAVTTGPAGPEPAAPGEPVCLDMSETTGRRSIASLSGSPAQRARRGAQPGGLFSDSEDLGRGAVDDALAGLWRNRNGTRAPDKRGHAGQDQGGGRAGL